MFLSSGKRIFWQAFVVLLSPFGFPLCLRQARWFTLFGFLGRMFFFLLLFVFVCSVPSTSVGVSLCPFSSFFFPFSFGQGNIEKNDVFLFSHSFYCSFSPLRSLDILGAFVNSLLLPSLFLAFPPCFMLLFLYNERTRHTKWDKETITSSSLFFFFALSLFLVPIQPCLEVGHDTLVFSLVSSYEVCLCL